MNTLKSRQPFFCTFPLIHITLNVSHSQLCALGVRYSYKKFSPTKMGVVYSRFFLPHPTPTEANLSSQKGKVFIMTGSASGVRFELWAILHRPGRSKVNAQLTISKIKTISTTSPGELCSLSLTLDNLATVKPVVEAFTARGSRLDVLFHNASVAFPPLGSVSAQGHELQMATNCLGYNVLTQFFLSTLLQIAKSGAVRVQWTSSVSADLSAPKCGIIISNFTNPPADRQKTYITSKAGTKKIENAPIAPFAVNVEVYNRAITL